MPTPKEDLIKANEDYHEAFNEILMGGEVPVEIKAKFGSLGDSIFSMMIKANELIAEYYE